MEREEQTVFTFYYPEVPKVKGDRRYKRPTLPTQHPSALMPPKRRQQHVDQTHGYIRMFCGSLCGFSLLVLICMSPLNWVQFLVVNDGLELYAGLWISCNHELCWSHTPKPPYYLQYSRAFFLISVFTILVVLGWLFSSCLPRRGRMTANLDLKPPACCSASSFFWNRSTCIVRKRWSQLSYGPIRLIGGVTSYTCLRGLSPSSIT
ncbi:transmembrane protein 202 isoform X3 [Odocoileus virginianus]|uniref:Transmembrane protein 202 isoform X3 n=1 Tax=Odocoileus virginianus TaxID=9874 RepID=A0A6J0XJB5_ODOVR